MGSKKVSFRLSATFAAIGALLLVAVALLAVHPRTNRHGAVRGQKDHPADLDVKQGRRLASVEHVLNDAFVVAVNKGDATIRVTHKSERNRVIWMTRKGDNFLRAAKGAAKIHENRGHFEVDDRISEETTELTMKSIHLHADGNSVVIKGEIRRRERHWFYFWKKIVTVDLRYHFTMATVSGSDGHLAFSTKLLNPNGSPKTSHNRIFLTYHTSPEEKFFGFGEQFTHMNMKGRELTIVTSENGIGRSDQGWLDFWMDLFFNGISGDFDSSYAPVPQYLTNKGRSVFLENYEISVFNLKDPNRVTVKLHGSNMRGRIIHGDNPLDLIESYTEYSGRMDVLPDWLNSGAVVGMQGGTERVYTVINQLRDLDTPIAAFWLQDWVGKRDTIVGSQLWWSWTLNEDRYPGWNDLVDSLDADGIRVMTYINPFLVDVDDADCYDGENLYRVAKDAGYLVKKSNGEVYEIPNTDFSAALIDLTNPNARDWMKSIIRENVIGAKASGWMADFGEALPFDAKLYSGESPDVFHNKFPEEFQKVNAEAVQEAGRDGDIVFFSRSAFTKSPGLTTLLWEGDQMVTFDENDGLKSAITALLTSGISGFSLNHNDIGGYTSVVIRPFFDITRSRELLKRWMEMNAFTAVFRTHEGIKPEENVQFYTDDDTLRHFSKFSKVYSALSFYRSTLMQEAATKGYPIARHPFLQYPNDPISYELKYQWMLGSEFVVAPVTEEGQVTVRVYLPEGLWIHVWSGQQYVIFGSGAWHTVSAPIGSPAVFYKGGNPAGETFRSNLEAMKVL